MIRYQIPSNVREKKIGKNLSLSILGSGSIIVDRPVLSMWRSAHNKNISEIIETSTIGPQVERIAILACLSEAGYLTREYQPLEPIPTNTQQNKKVSVIVVSFNSQTWLDNCISSIHSQDYQNIEITVVDNASSDNTVLWVNENHPNIKLVRLDRSRSLAHAINAGIRESDGDYFLLLNPDVTLEPSALSEMVTTMAADPHSAAAASKLKLRSNPAFINGIGNYVGPISWGTDLALGHLDLGQFDDLNNVPSACFAAALISSTAYNDVGIFDVGFPLYYEDSEWCYRARILGYKISAAPSAVGWHAFSSRSPTNRKSTLSPGKLEQVVYGRLRFSMKLLSPPYLLYFICLYIIEDFARMVLSLITGRWDHFKAYVQGWSNIFRTINEIFFERKKIQARRVISDKELFHIQKLVPIVLIKGGFPQLTRDIIRHIYLPNIAAGKTKLIPEFNLIKNDQYQYKPESGLTGLFLRARDIIAAEGFQALLDRTGRLVQWYLMRP